MTMPPFASTRRIGRPIDQHLTRRLLASTVHLLAEQGLPLSSDKVATHAGAGKAAIYRRWPHMSALVSDALHTCSVVPPAPDTGSTRADLTSWLAPFAQQLTTHDRAAAAATGWALFDDALNEAVTAVVRTPLLTATTAITDAHSRRGAHIPAGGQQRLLHVVQALWWHRYSGTNSPSDRPNISAIVEGILLPLITTGQSSMNLRSVRYYPERGGISNDSC